MRRRFQDLLAVIVLAAGAAAQEADSDGARFQPMDVFELEWAADPRISPVGGRQVVYVRSGMDVLKDRTRSALWIASAGGGGHRPIATKGDPRSPRWSPGGERILYVSDESGSAQIWVHHTETGRSVQVTRVLRSPSSPSWSPDGRHIAFTMPVDLEEKPFVDLPPKPEGAEWAAPPIVIERATYRHDGRGYVENEVRQLFVVPAEGGTPRQITRGPYSVRGTAAWTGDGSELIFSSNRRPDWEYDSRDTELWAVAVASGEMRQLTDRRGPDNAPLVSPDGSLLAWLGHDDRKLSHQGDELWVMPLAGGPPESLTKDLDRGIARFQWVPSIDSGLCVQYVDRGAVTVAHVALDGEVTRIAADLGGSIGRPYAGGSFTVSGTAGDDDDRRPWHRVAYTLGSPDAPADVAVADARGGSRRITRLNDDLLPHRKLATVEGIRYESAKDGRDIQGWIMKPADFDPRRRYPLILEIHGGPHAAYVPTWSSEFQLYAAEGHVVLFTNPRGSTGYGREFANLIHHRYPGDDYHDLMSGVDAVVAKGWIDTSRLYVTGGSGGGVLTSWIVGKTDRFSAAVVAKPVINWFSFALTTDGYLGFARRWFPGPPWENLQHYMKRSPISLVGNVETPTMLLTGEEDTRTPMSESEQYYQALKLRKVPSMLVRIPGASHSIASRPSRLIAKVACILAWFERHGGAEGQ